MRRLLLALTSTALVLSAPAACSSGPGESTTTPPPSSPPKGDVAVLAERLDQRRTELKTARFHTEGFATDGNATEVRNTIDGTLRQDPDGITGSMAMQMATGGQNRKMDMVMTRDGLYVHVDGAPMPEGKKWGFYTRQNSGDVDALLRGFGPGATVGAELDYVQPRAALIVNRAAEQLDGTPTTRYDLVVDPMKMAKVIENPDIQLQHTQLAEFGITIRAVVWVDDTGAPQKAEYRFELDGKVVKQSTTRFTEWGQPFDFPTPAPAEVVPADQLPK
ncbi:hypothetical protein ABZ816_11280 [Actinosynnema sp. NPDC047251]|uniref:Lipoprotein n=1 Tax=Saccharothrix espanaensis (strain ATCC 51144 / DSM 44229 / JCM 9112 / NBRC 15066 / NRRL 15764) TaxID=1179773 RepID=K0K2C4_SACES|nr:hypothetical protein [Saccharothrix espanaensis]CCH34400.1 hypothetical protein BN6_71650 [Saccharothrix espanaensis DSM 44229]